MLTKRLLQPFANGMRPKRTLLFGCIDQVVESYQPFGPGKSVLRGRCGGAIRSGVCFVYRFRVFHRRLLRRKASSESSIRQAYQAVNRDSRTR